MKTALGFAAERYDMKTFFDVLGKDRVMQSWIWQLGVDEGQVKYARQVCADLVAEFHPAVAADLIPVVEVCDKPETLRSWILQCAKLPDGAFVALVKGKPPVRVARAAYDTAFAALGEAALTGGRGHVRAAIAFAAAAARDDMPLPAIAGNP